MANRCIFKEQQQSIIRHTDALFSRMMLWQWVFAVGLAVWLSPRAWAGASSQVHLHVWMAILLGATISSAPVLLARFRPGRATTRHVIGIGQMLMSALLIHLTGGRNRNALSCVRVAGDIGVLSRLESAHLGIGDSFRGSPFAGDILATIGVRDIERANMAFIRARGMGDFRSSIFDCFNPQKPAGNVECGGAAGEARSTE